MQKNITFTIWTEYIEMRLYVYMDLSDYYLAAFRAF